MTRKMIVRTAVGAVVFGLFGLGSVALATVGTQADISGSVRYPDSSANGAVGGLNDATFEDHSGFRAGDVAASATINRTKSGVADNGISGTSSVSGTMRAELGTLHGTATASVVSAPGPGSSFVAAEASLASGKPIARFWDEVRVFDSSVPLGTPLMVVASVNLDWSYVPTNSPYVTFTALAYANLNVAGYGGATASGSMDHRGVGTYTPFDSGMFRVDNGTVLDVFGQLQIGASISVGGQPPEATGGTVTSNAANTAHFYLDGVSPTTTLVSVSTGRSYATPVPEPVGALGCAVLSVVAGRRRRV